jgi:hypothetical protein
MGNSGRVGKNKVFGEMGDDVFWGEKEHQVVIGKMFPCVFLASVGMVCYWGT